MDGIINLERIAKLLTDLNPDVIAVPEVDKSCKRSGIRDLAEELGRLTGMRHRFGKSWITKEVNTGWQSSRASLLLEPGATNSREVLNPGARWK